MSEKRSTLKVSCYPHSGAAQIQANTIEKRRRQKASGSSSSHTATRAQRVTRSFITIAALAQGTLTSRANTPPPSPLLLSPQNTKRNTSTDRKGRSTKRSARRRIWISTGRRSIPTHPVSAPFLPLVALSRSLSRFVFVPLACQRLLRVCLPAPSILFFLFSLPILLALSFVSLSLSCTLYRA